MTRSPTASWVAQQLRNATPWDTGPRFLIRDNDDKFGRAFDRVADGTGLRILRTPVKAPRANAVCERFLGSVRRECLDHVLIFGERHTCLLFSRPTLTTSTMRARIRAWGREYHRARLIPPPRADGSWPYPCLAGSTTTTGAQHEADQRGRWDEKASLPRGVLL